MNDAIPSAIPVIVAAITAPTPTPTSARKAAIPPPNIVRPAAALTDAATNKPMVTGLNIDAVAPRAAAAAAPANIPPTPPSSDS